MLDFGFWVMIAGAAIAGSNLLGLIGVGIGATEEIAGRALVGFFLFFFGLSTSDNEKLIEFRKKLKEKPTEFIADCLHYRIAPYRQQVGISLVIAGVGVIAILLPDILRYIVQSDVYLAHHEFIRLGLAAMMVTGGWHLRKSEAESHSLMLVVMLVATACTLVEGWIAWNHFFPPARPELPRRYY